MCLLTTPLNIVIPAQMVEKALVVVYPCLRETYHRLNNEVQPLVKLKSIQMSPSKALQVERVREHDFESIDSLGSSLSASRTPSIYFLCINRLLFVLSSTLFAYYLPCFGTVFLKSI